MGQLRADVELVHQRIERGVYRHSPVGLDLDMQGRALGLQQRHQPRQRRPLQQWLAPR